MSSPECGCYWSGFIHFCPLHAAAEKALEAERDAARDDGWGDMVEDICWGRISGKAVETERRPATEDEKHRFDEYMDYALADVVVPQQK